MKLIILCAMVGLLFCCRCLAGDNMTRPKDLRDIIGAAHVAGKYNFTKEDYLNEGADRLLALGCRVIKLWFTPNPSKDYPFNSEWPKFDNWVDLAKTEYYQKVFAKPFTTFILEAFPPNDANYVDGMTAGEIKRTKASAYELAKYLLTKYQGTGKTFILQNWEGDWILTNPQFTKEPSPATIQGMIDWLNARQDGIEQARREVGMKGVVVAHAAEANLVDRAMQGKITVANNVIPKTHCDLYSYSAYDTIFQGPEKFRKALDYLASKAPPSKLYGKQNIYIGEFGAPENEMEQGRITKQVVETALSWGARYIVYWEVFCNEPANRDWKDRPENKDMRGFWLIRPDGTKSPAYDYLWKLLNGK